MLGRVQPGHFPAVFGEGGDLPLDADLVRTRFAALADEVGRATGRRPDEAEAAAGFLEIAVLSMANAVKKISVQRGHDITRYALTGFGGAGGQHVCAVADALGIDTVLVPRSPGCSPRTASAWPTPPPCASSPWRRRLDRAALERVERLCAELADRTREALRADGTPDSAITTRARVLLRYAGTDAALSVDLDTETAMAEAFAAAHRARFGFTMDKPVVVETVSVEATGATGATDVTGVTGATEATGATGGAAPAASTRSARRPPRHPIGPGRHRAPVRRGAMAAGPAVPPDGPAPRRHRHRARRRRRGRRHHCRRSRLGGRSGSGRAPRSHPQPPRPERTAVGTRVDPVMLEVFNNLFMSIAEQMGVRLENTAHSVNIKERLDFSCAVFDAEGNLIANAPHIPVHLGSMGESIKEVLRRNEGACAPATCTPSTTRTTAAPTSPMSPW